MNKKKLNKKSTSSTTTPRPPANKLMGQHFLTDMSVLAAIIAAAGIKKTDTVIEIGPGTGVLTEALLEKTSHVIAIEKDPRLVKYLEENLSAPITLIEGDVLKEADREKAIKLTKGLYKIVANIPYYLTGKVFEHFLETTKTPPTSMTLLVQHEVATRIMGSLRAKGKGNIASIAVRAYGVPHIIKKVLPGAFHNPPKVNSAILHINNISKDFFVSRNILEKDFFALVRKGFGSKRKKLRNTLGDIVEGNPLAEKRPEDLSPEDWATLL